MIPVRRLYLLSLWSLAGSTCYSDFRHCWLSSEGGYCAHSAGNGEWRRRHNWIGRPFLRSYSGWACHSRDQHSMSLCLNFTSSWLSPQIALKNDIDYATVLEQLREARFKGLTIPVLLMGISNASMIWTLNQSCKIGYYNPLLAYGEDKAIQDAANAGANGFIMVDLPPEEALTFREKCRKAECV